MNRSALIVAAEVVAMLVVVLYWQAYRRRHDPRLFTYQQRMLVGNAFGANCVWRPVHWLPAAAAYVVLGPQPGARGQAGLALVLLAGFGLPLTRTSGRCGGTIQGGHQRSHADGGTASIFNLSPECFPAGVRVATARGQVPIEDVVVGDLVVTHRGRLRSVSAARARQADTVIVRGSGHQGIETTPNHPFLTRPFTGTRNAKGHIAKCSLGAEQWTSARELVGQFWASLAGLQEPVPCPAMPFDPGDLATWWIIGRWLGDGGSRVPTPINPSRHVFPSYARAAGPCQECPAPRRKTARNGLWSIYCGPACAMAACRRRRRERGFTGSAELTICCGHHEADVLAGRLPGWKRRELRTATLFTRYDQHSLVVWLDEHFGRGAQGKRLPLWVLGLPVDQRQSLLDGYTSADGHRAPRKGRPVAVTTVSRELAVGVKMLADSLGMHAHLGTHAGGGPALIEGRSVNTRPKTHVRWTTEHVRAPKAKTIEGTIWSQVREVLPGRQHVTVYCLTVADDESYIADGLVVHNCATHNLDKSATGSWPWAFVQWPWTPLSYLVRHVRGTVTVMWLLATDSRARRQAEKGLR